MVDLGLESRKVRQEQAQNSGLGFTTGCKRWWGHREGKARTIRKAWATGWKWKGTSLKSWKTEGLGTLGLKLRLTGSYSTWHWFACLLCASPVSVSGEYRILGWDGMRTPITLTLWTQFLGQILKEWRLQSKALNKLALLSLSWDSASSSWSIPQIHFPSRYSF